MWLQNGRRGLRPPDFNGHNGLDRLHHSAIGRSGTGGEWPRVRMRKEQVVATVDTESAEVTAHMALSEHEQRILEEIERQLAADDPGFVARARRTADRSDRRLWFAIAGFALGFLCLLGITFGIVWGVIGFALMFTSVVVGAQAVRDRELPKRLSQIRSRDDA